MDCQAQVLIKGPEGKWLLVESASGRLLVPASRLRESEDFFAAAQRCLLEDVGVSAEIKGISKIVHTSHRKCPKMTVVFVADEAPGSHILGAPQCKTKWCTEEEIKAFSNFVLDQHDSKLVLEAYEHVLPLSLLESQAEGGEKRRRESGSMGLDRSALRQERPLEDQLLEQAGYKKYELEQISVEFCSRCGSSDGEMDKATFAALMNQLGYPERQCDDCFRAFVNVSKSSPNLSLWGLQLGLCTMDPLTPHGDICAQFRCQYIFEFYNVSGTGRLSYPELRRMYVDICEAKGVSVVDQAQLEKRAQENWRVFESPDGILLSAFLTLPPRSGLEVIKDEGDDGEDQMDTGDPVGLKKPAGGARTLQKASSVGSIPPSAMCEEGDEDPLGGSIGFGAREYSIATHFVRVHRSGVVADVMTLWDLAGTEAVSGSTLESILSHSSKPGFDRLPSINAFDKKSKSKEMLSGLRYFEHTLKDDGRGCAKAAFSWGAVDMASVARCFIDLCLKAIDVFASEPRLLEMASPVYVLGDIHGNFRDLSCFEKVLWRMGPVLTPAKFLFLGDYVDRGKHGFEVVAYLLAQKLLTPSKFMLIRGNHEIRVVQESFSYKRECVEKFGEQLGMEVWEATNKVFDVLPLAAVIDKKIFCVHGGIPHPDLCEGLISSINDIPTNLPTPMESNLLAWEVMWNDPIRQDDIDASIEEQLAQNDGFVDNFARGTAHMFSAEALNEFLKKNDLSHVIRAHEMKAAGFQIQQHGRLLTVFSSSLYCGASNEAACVLVDNLKIRTIRLDTT
eukprot:Em0015g321a